MNRSLGVITPQGRLASHLATLAELSSAGGDPAEIAEVLEGIAPSFEEQGKANLAARVIRFAAALKEGSTPRTVFLQSPLFRELDSLRERLGEDVPLETALQGRSAVEEFQRLTGPQTLRAQRFAPSSQVTHALRLAIGPKPLIDWKKFGSARYEAPREPSADVKTIGQQLAYFVFYAAGMAGHGESNSATAAFYEISEDQLRRLQKGLFAPEALGQFPSEAAFRLIAKATALTPPFGQLMRELLILAIFESQGWSLGQPRGDAFWDISFMYALRRYAAAQFLTERGKENVLADTALVRAIKNRNALERVDWHPGRTRREVFEPWLKALCGGDEKRLSAMRAYIGEGILKAAGWKKPPPHAGEDLQLQWRLRHWIAHHHYGALPARGLPFSTQIILRFAFAKNPADLTPGFRKGLLEMMK